MLCALYLRNLDAVLVEMSPSEIGMMLEALDTNFTLPSPIKQHSHSQSHSQSLQSPRDARTGGRHRGNSLGESDLKKPNRSQSIVQNNINNMTTPLKGDRKGSFDKSPSDATSDHITPAKPTYNRDRALSKDLDSIDSVKRYIRAVKKKLASIADIEQKLLSSSPPPTTLNPSTSSSVSSTTDDHTPNINSAFTMQTTHEQQEKLGRKGACQSELKRLQLILTRLEREETSKSQFLSFYSADSKDNSSGFLSTPQLSPAPFSNNLFNQHPYNNDSGASQMRVVEPPKGFEAWTTMVSPSKSREARLAAAEGKGSRSSSVADLQLPITSTNGGALNKAKANLAPVPVNMERTKVAYTDNNPSLSAVGKGGRTVLSPPAPALTTAQKPPSPMAASLSAPPLTATPSPTTAPPSSSPLSSPFFSAKPAVSTAAYVTPKKPSQPTATIASSSTPVITNPLTIVAPIGKVSGVSLSSFIIQSSVAKEPVITTPKPAAPSKNPWTLPSSSVASTSVPAAMSKPTPVATPVTPLNKHSNPTDTRSIPNTKPPYLPSPTPHPIPHTAPHPTVTIPKKSLVEIQREEERLHTSLFTQRNCIVDRFESAWSVGVTKGNHTTTMKQLMTAQEEETLRDEQCRRDEELARQIAQEEQMYNNIHTGKRGHKGGNQGKGKKGNNNREKANKT